MPRRLCGSSRVAGGVYLSAKAGAGGLSASSFLVDPPVPLTWQDLDKLSLSTLGVNPREVKHSDGTTTYTIFDWIGVEHYPFWPDFYEEVRRYGLSRRISMSAATIKAFQKDGTYVLVHPHGHIIDPEAHINQAILRGDSCPVDRHNPSVWPHMASMDNRHCQALLWEAIDDEKDPYINPHRTRQIERKGADFSYTAYKSPVGVLPEFAPAIVMSIPLKYCRFEVVRTDSSLTAETVARSTKKLSNLETVITQE